ncbi:unnamed protein product [Oikopleura dioica]|uniref:Uncharacterized protein n=1 Tax=Oikopleura dioica TaxID=34765 RepID=Q66S48_OIKDI|nr:hypothetical protein 008-11 [Oikopleura dioica]CBY07765.1 unnamed protein product [Oikopleura dioica]CBY39560.1 unnamed protein product [Oikopleura dioica]
MFRIKMKSFYSEDEAFNSRIFFDTLFCRVLEQVRCVRRLCRYTKKRSTVSRKGRSVKYSGQLLRCVLGDVTVWIRECAKCLERQQRPLSPPPSKQPCVT